MLEIITFLPGSPPPKGEWLFSAASAGVPSPWRLGLPGWAPSLSSAPPPAPSGLFEWTEGLLLSPHGISIASTVMGIIPVGGILQVAFTRKSEGGAPAGLVFLFVLAFSLCLWLLSLTCPWRSTDPNCVSLLYDLCPESELPDLPPCPLKKHFSGCESPSCFYL